MQTYNDDDVEEETLSLSKFYKEEDDDTISSQGSLSSSSLSDQEFLGFFSSDEANGNNTSSYGTILLPENIVFCGKVISSGEARHRINNEVNKSTQTASWPLFRSTSDSFRFMRLKTSSTRPSPMRSKSLPNRSTYSFPYKSKLMVFMFGSRSSKFLNKQQVEMSDIKSRQLRRQSSMTTAILWPVESYGKKEENNNNNNNNGGQKSGMSKGWWRVVDVLGCGGGGYQKDTNY